MLFRRLEYFVAVAEERHFARAAQRCHVSQPALSAAIAKLERELDTQLIIRGRNFEGLTQEGQRLLEWAKRILAEYDALRAELRFSRSEVTGTLRLGTIPTAATTVSLMLGAFCAAHPLVKVQVHSAMATSELDRRLHSAELDVAIVPVHPDISPAVKVVPLYEERYLLVTSAEKLPMDASWLCWRDAAQLPLLLLTQNMLVRQVIDNVFADHGITVNPRVETDSIATLIAQVSTGDWACIVPHTWLSTTILAGDTRAVELIEPTLKTQIAVATNASGPTAPVARAFVDSAQQLKLHEFFDQRLGPIDAVL